MEISQASILISSSEPAKLAKFYSLVMNSSFCKGLNESHYEINMHTNIPITFFKPSSKRDVTNTTINGTAICFQKQSSNEPMKEIHTWIEQLTSIGGKIVEGPKLDFFGAEAWISDLDGNTFLILVPLNKDGFSEVSDLKK